MWPAQKKINSQQSQPTCTAHGAKKATRTNFVPANEQAVLAITSCGVDTQASFDVHSPIAIQMCPRNFSPTVFVAKELRLAEAQTVVHTAHRRGEAEQQRLKSTSSTDLSTETLLEGSEPVGVGPCKDRPQ